MYFHAQNNVLSLRLAHDDNMRDSTPQGSLSIVRLTYQQEMVTSGKKWKRQGVYQQDVINRDRLSTRRYQQRPFINMVDSWYARTQYEVLQV
jgi:hypothetical protein